MMRAFIGICLLLVMVGCGHRSVDHYQNTQPKLLFEEFFDGELVAYGMVLDRSGHLLRRFEVKMLASWQGEKGEIKEWFVFDDGEKSTRIWQINKLSENRFEGTAEDVIGVAQGQTSGAALYWSYVLAIPIDGEVFHITLDDWMYLLDDKRLFNKTKMSKWGFNVGEIIIYIEKKD